MNVCSIRNNKSIIANKTNSRESSISNTWKLKMTVILKNITNIQIVYLTYCYELKSFQTY